MGPPPSSETDFLNHGPGSENARTSLHEVAGLLKPVFRPLGSSNRGPPFALSGGDAGLGLRTHGSLGSSDRRGHTIARQSKSTTLAGKSRILAIENRSQGIQRIARLEFIAALLYF